MELLGAGRQRVARARRAPARAPRRHGSGRPASACRPGAAAPGSRRPPRRRHPRSSAAAASRASAGPGRRTAAAVGTSIARSLAAARQLPAPNRSAAASATCGRGPARVLVGAEVPGGRERGRVHGQPLGQEQVARQRVEHVLPWPHALRVAQVGRLAGGEGADQVGQQPAGREVAAADDVAGARRGQADAAVRREEAAAIGLGRRSRRRPCWRCRDRAPPSGVALGAAPVGPQVAFVAGDHDDRARADGRRRAASSRLTAPRMLLWKVATGSCRLSSTSGCAARWKIDLRLGLAQVARQQLARARRRRCGCGSGAAGRWRRTATARSTAAGRCR